MKVNRRVKDGEELFTIALTRTEARMLYEGFGGVVSDPKLVADLADRLAVLLKK